VTDTRLLERYLNDRRLLRLTDEEVNRPDRATRHRVGKSDPIDAESATRGQCWQARPPAHPSMAMTASR